ncbi:MAG: isopentenyl-diphosphate Delta-isomerase [Pseudolysinimonas sp.]|uniref:isopentenyl-diphosphate Delta-isomerase n=1 Tax=Pseudolysinimonas sp. TaxID=2680009 RepID=UPI003265F0F8
MSYPSGSSPEQVVLLSEDGDPIGTADKATVHGDNTPLHLAFSCHVFDARGRMLVTRRALGKAAFPGVWTNAFCGHPAPGEDPLDAIRRRGLRELALPIHDLEVVLPNFRYRAVDAGGVVENEICPVYRSLARDDPMPRPDEVDDWAWVKPGDLVKAVTAAPFAFSPWLVLQLQQWDPIAA